MRNTMKMYFGNKIRVAVLVLCSSFMIPESHTHNVHVKITNIRNNKGRIQLQIYKDQSSFAKETPWRTKLISKQDLKGSTLNYVIPGLADGTYGIAILDDENRNTEMDYSFLVPKEGFGFSNYYHTAWSKPEFNDFKFSIKGADEEVSIKVRYL